MESWRDRVVFEDEKMPHESLDDAESVLRSGLVVNPRSFDLRAELANLFMTRNDYSRSPEKAEEAARLFRELHEEQPASLVALFGLAEVAHRQRNWSEVKQLTERMERLVSFTENPEAFQHLITLLAFVPGEGRDRAQALLRRALAVDPSNAGYWMLLGLLIEDEDPEEAARHLAEARRLLPDHPWDEDLDKERKLLSRWGPEWWGEAE